MGKIIAVSCAPMHTIILPSISDPKEGAKGRLLSIFHDETTAAVSYDSEDGKNMSKNRYRWMRKRVRTNRNGWRPRLREEAVPRVTSLKSHNFSLMTPEPNRAKTIEAKRGNGRKGNFY